MSDKKIKLITHLGISGDCDLDLGGKRVTFKLNPYLTKDGQKVGTFDVTPEQLKLIEKTDHWKMTYIQLEAKTGGVQESADPANNVVNVGTVINPLGFSSMQVQLIENALLVKPALREILADNVLDACKKILDAENLPPKHEKKPLVSKKAKSKTPTPKKKARSVFQPVLKYPTNEEILGMNEDQLKVQFKKFGGEYNIDLDKTMNMNALMDLVEAEKAK